MSRERAEAFKASCAALGRKQLNAGPITSDNLLAALEAISRGNTQDYLDEVSVTVTATIRRRLNRFPDPDEWQEVQESWDAKALRSLAIGPVDLAESLQDTMDREER